MRFFFVKILFLKVKRLYPSFWKSGIKTLIMVFHDTMLLTSSISGHPVHCDWTFKIPYQIQTYNIFSCFFILYILALYPGDKSKLRRLMIDHPRKEFLLFCFIVGAFIRCSILCLQNSPCLLAPPSSFFRTISIIVSKQKQGRVHTMDILYPSIQILQWMILLDGMWNTIMTPSLLFYNYGIVKC